MDIFAQAAQKIIREQENIIGPVALEQAQKVPGLTVDSGVTEVKIEGDEKNVLEHLVEKYRDLFGTASVEVCKDAVKSIKEQFPQGQLPSLLQ